MASRLVRERLPVQPLLDRLGMTGADLARQTGHCKTWVSRVVSRGGLSIEQADELAIRFGTHPALLWPEEWFACLEGEPEEQESLW